MTKTTITIGANHQAVYPLDLLLHDYVSFSSQLERYSAPQAGFQRGFLKGRLDFVRNMLLRVFTAEPKDAQAAGFDAWVSYMCAAYGLSELA